MAHDLWLFRKRFEHWKLLLGDEYWEEHFADRLSQLDERLYELEAEYITLLTSVIVTSVTDMALRKG